MVSFTLVMLVALPASGPITVRGVEPGQELEVSIVLSKEQAASLDTTRVGKSGGKRLLWLATRDAQGRTGPPIFARYQLDKNRLLLRPSFPLLPETTYVATARLPNGQTTQTTITISRRGPRTAPEVTRVFPSGDRLPANCLKFYVHFSAPMREGREIFEQIQIVAEDGEVVPDPWRRVELWSTDAKRLTLWIHPGRIKRGVNLREEFGPVLRPNQKYHLVIPKRVLGANGMKLEAEFSKAFETTAEDHTRPLPKHWQIDAPSVGTREPLQIRFGKSLDRAQLLRMITVVASDGRTIRGSISIGSGESTWNFRPSENWMNNRHQLIVDGRLEDAAGNTPLRPFDNDLGSRTLVAPRLSITFTPSFKPKD